MLIYGLFLLGLIWRRHAIHTRPLLTTTMGKEGCVEHEEYLRLLLADSILGGGQGLGSANPSPCQNSNANSNSLTDPFMQGKQKKKEWKLNEFLRKQKTLQHV